MYTYIFWLLSPVAGETTEELSEAEVDNACSRTSSVELPQRGEYTTRVEYVDDTTYRYIILRQYSR